ncbi:MAG: Hsp70 family protein, partial [Nitrospirae bacterium]|nr:Hsp70 family protein [Nitrospirota bacterium]
SSGLSDDEIKKMVKDAEAHAEEDRKKKELVTVRNEADALVYAVEKSLKEYGDKVTPAEKAEAEEALKRLKDMKDTATDPEELKKAVEALTTVSHKFAEHIYKDAAAKSASEQGQQPGGEGGQQKAGGPEEEVVEAEFEDVDKNKKQ